MYHPNLSMKSKLLKYLLDPNVKVIKDNKVSKEKLVRITEK